MVIHEADPRVTMMLAINMRPDPQLENSLDYSERDDQLVGIASAYSNNFTDTEVSVLTYDTGPMLSAKNVPIFCFLRKKRRLSGDIPADEWTNKRLLHVG